MNEERARALQQKHTTLLTKENKKWNATPIRQTAIKCTEINNNKSRMKTWAPKRWAETIIRLTESNEQTHQ